MPADTIKILGINFYNGSAGGVVDILKTGGLLVVPAAPALINIKEDKAYYASLINADVVIPDSGYMALIWNAAHLKKVNRISGLEFLRAFFDDKEMITLNSMLLVNPSLDEADANLQFLNGIGFSLNNNDSYLAPFYNKQKVEDPALLQLIEERKPKYILVNIGGGTQEKLGAWLKKNLSYKPAIICTGAAIAFLTGRQANIPNWADKFYLGWLLRCIQNPKLYIPRYFGSFKLLFTILKYGSKKPG